MSRWLLLTGIEIHPQQLKKFIYLFILADNECITESPDPENSISI